MVGCTDGSDTLNACLTVHDLPNHLPGKMHKREWIVKHIIYVLKLGEAALLLFLDAGPG